MKLAEIVAQEIVHDIVVRDLKEGDRLPTEAEMLEQFDVGRASIREALRVLESYGLISIRQGQNGGPVVASPHAEDLAATLSLYFHMDGATYGELVEARLVIEPMMAQLAAETQDAEYLKLLREVVEEEQAADFGDHEYLEKSDAFHFAVAGMSGNRVLDLVGRALRSLFQQRNIHGVLLDTDQRPHNREVHAEIAAAIEAGDGELARKLMEEHLREVADLLDDQVPAAKTDRITWGSGG